MMDEDEQGVFSMPGAFAALGPSEPTASVRTLILHFSLSSTTSKLASLVHAHITAVAPHLAPELNSLVDYDLDALLLSTPRSPLRTVCLFLLPSYNVETALDSVIAQVADVHNDFRVSRDALAGLSFGVLGVGHSDYGDKYCKQAKELDRMLGGLGGRRIVKLGQADSKVDPERDATRWARELVRAVGAKARRLEDVPIVPDESVVPLDDEPVTSEEEEESAEPVTKASLAKSRARRKAALRSRPSDDLDIEDVGVGLPQSMALPTSSKLKAAETKDMISPLTRKNLTKQGYALVGSHSGVKTCRWTKASLRGRGFCYKHAFYGIQSHRCMEATPSLACANKCTFCWRSHSNPVGTSWRWNTDDPDFVVEQSLKEHDRLIKQLLGMPGVRPDRFEEARTPKHAALSLVGEPVMYPHIHRYIRLLTERGISTFLVTNAQFPEALRNLPPVTQLYLSIDAGTKDSLKAIDRPLHRDFWERFLESIDIIRTKRARSVFRLTLVKDHNCSESEISAYATLIRRGRPDFIEVKGVTFCGYGGSSGLSIQNSPFHEEVVSFVQNLCDELGGEWDLAAEHAHSCCVLAARKDYQRDGRWWTWIDYPKFFELVESGQPFDGADFAAPTPDFAVFGAPEAGFSPEDERWFRKGSKPKPTLVG